MRNPFLVTPKEFQDPGRWHHGQLEFVVNNCMVTLLGDPSSVGMYCCVKNISWILLPVTVTGLPGQDSPSFFKKGHPSMVLLPCLFRHPQVRGSRSMWSIFSDSPDLPQKLLTLNLLEMTKELNCTLWEEICVTHVLLLSTSSFNAHDETCRASDVFLGI